MKSALWITLLLSLYPGITQAMEEQPITMEATNPPPDLMPTQALRIIKMLQSTDKSQHPDHITIIGEAGSGKSTISARIMREIDGAGFSCDGYDLRKSYGKCHDEQAIRKSVLEDLILPTVAEAKKEGKSRAVFIIPAFEVLYNNQSNPIRYVLKALNPANFTNLERPLLIINETLPLKNHRGLPPVEGDNVIHIAPPMLQQREKLIQYWVNRYHYPCNDDMQYKLAMETPGKSISMLQLYLRNACAREIQKQKGSPSKGTLLEDDHIIGSTDAPLPSSTNLLSKEEFTKLTEATRLKPPTLTSPPPDQESTKCCCLIS